ncbi:MAG TPA: DUF2721 domain-containing protein, partial [Gemmatimonadaceae bacterium]|nr:DUF2721 domain-containing protein [Gemmatimonadaceae bacterium]
MIYLQSGASVESVAHVIDLAVAPVFLISGVAAMLVVLTNRLGRIIDRARRLEDRLPDADATHAEALHHELALLARRARLINLAISLCTTSALLVCMVIGALFLAALLGGVVGWERERRDRPAGLRTHILVCLGSALITL